MTTVATNRTTQALSEPTPRPEGASDAGPFSAVAVPQHKAAGTLGTSVPARFSEWYLGGDVYLCQRCYLTANFKPFYKPVESPLPDLDEDIFCESCGSAPCRLCGNGVLPLGQKYCAKCDGLCLTCNGDGELGCDPNKESPQQCPDCSGRGCK